MKAVVLDQFGGPDVLHLADLPDPQPAPGEVRVAVRAAGVNPFDGKVRSGAMEQQFTTQLPKVLGIEVAGVVDALGEGVTDVAVGDRVLGWAAGSTGSYAELALSRTYGVLPDEVTFEQAVTIPVAAETAGRVLDLLELKPGETLLLLGASGAVGEVGAQLALQRGATVIGTAGEANQDRLRALGVTVTTYGDGLVDRVKSLAPQGIDAVFDAAGKGALPDAITLRGGTDRVVTIADPAAFELGVTFTSQGDPSVVDLSGLARHLASGELTTTIGAVFPFAQAAQAHTAVDSGHAGGKVVLTP
jgi:NADPH:quinone reductase-like Zn-dependent oxidoreductase